MDDRSKGRPGLAVLVMLVTPLLFSTNLVFGRGVVDEVAPFTLAFLRWASVAVALSPFLLLERRTAFAVLRGNAALVVLLGFLGMWLCGAIVYRALAMTTATNGTLIFTTSPVIILFIEAIFRGRSIGRREAIGSAIAFVGVAVIVLKGDLGALSTLDVNAGDLIMLGMAVAWATYSILYRSPPLATLSNLALFCAVAAAGALTLLPFAAGEFLLAEPMPRTASAWTSIAGIVVFSSLLAFSGFQYGVRRLGPSAAGVFMYLLPPYGVFLAVTFLGETFHAFHAVGIALVMGGIALATAPAALFRRRRAK